MKLFEIPDLHFDPRWADTTENAIGAVEREAAKSPPDLIAIPGDLHNRPLYAADRSGYSRLLDIVRRLVAIAPVAAIEGTPSHDAPGSYAPLEELGLVLLRPGRVYLLTPGKIVDVARTGPLAAQPLAVLFGIPELDKDGAAALGADARAGDVLTAWNNYIDEFLAPHRAGLPELPAVALLHGVVSDASRENEEDVIKKSSSLLLHTGDMERAGVTRWVLGDIHTPWESERISAGYAGFTGVDDNPWGKTGFVPAFNVTTIGLCNIVTRVPYGTPKRIKLTAPAAAYHPDIAYWLDSDVDDPALDPRKHGAHPWSRMTYTPTKETTRRVTKDEAEEAKSAGDLLALMMPDEATDARREIADQIDVATGSRIESREIELKSIRVAGASFFSGKTVTLDIEEIPDGLTAITGDNGAGKSSLLAFCSPYPVVIGKDTESGRPSAIKEFFSEKESFIGKLFTVNGEPHRHLITIKGAQTKSPRTECFLYINDKNVLETTNFDAMMTKCEELYGPLEDYLRTYQYVQPQQGGAPSGLMSAGAVELRNVVQNIAGIDRSTERRAALDKSNDIEREADQISDQINGMVLIAEDPQVVEARIGSLEKVIVQFKQQLEKAEDALDVARTTETKEAATLRQAEINEEAVTEYHKKLTAAKASVAGIAERRERYLRAIREAEKAQEEIETDNLAHNKLDAWATLSIEIRGRNDRKEKEYAISMKDYADKKLLASNVINENSSSYRNYEAKREGFLISIDQMDRKITAAQELAIVLADPCEACGHVSSDNQSRVNKEDAKIREARAEAKRSHEELTALSIPESVLVPAVGPEPTPPAKEPLPPEIFDDVLADEDREELETVVRLADNAAAILPEINREYEEKAEAQRNLEETAPEEVDICYLLAAVRSATVVRTAAEDHWRAAVKDVENTEARLEVATEALEKARRVQSDIKEAKAKVEDLFVSLEDWRWVAAMMAPAKLPAFELELILDSIDARATANIAPFREGRYRIRTETQREGADGRVDKFQVIVYDAETGAERSFLKHSPGEKAFVALAYQRSLIAEREDRTGVTYSPHILDEADGPVQPARVPEFYAMQAETVGGAKALIVSHAPDAQYYIGNTISIEELKA